MKLVVDTCVSGSVSDALQAAGHDVVWTGRWRQDPGDEEILDYAYREGRIVVTLDKDFSELAVVHGRAHSGILRLVNWPIQQQSKTCL